MSRKNFRPSFSGWPRQDGIPRAVGDYLAGMTDRFALEEHRRLVGG